MRCPLVREWWARLDAATRLLYVRVALFILAEPPDPAARHRKESGNCG
jgi:hypothetical protein